MGQVHAGQAGVTVGLPDGPRTLEVALNGARALWKAVVAEGLHAQYWSEESGRWQMKTEKPASG